MSSATRPAPETRCPEAYSRGDDRIDWREAYLPAEHVDHLPVHPEWLSGLRLETVAVDDDSLIHSFALAGPFESISCSVNGPLLARARVVRLEKTAAS